jgi:hypothetical protein
MGSFYADKRGGQAIRGVDVVPGEFAFDTCGYSACGTVRGLHFEYVPVALSLQVNFSNRLNVYANYASNMSGVMGALLIRLPVAW